MRIFQTKLFKKWSQNEGLSDSDLCLAIVGMEAGLTGANLGGNVCKIRVKLEGRGKSGGARTLLAYKTKEKAFFIYGFSKKNRENIGPKEEAALKKLAKELLEYT